MQETVKPQYPFWQALFRSFFDRKFYVDAAEHRQGTGCLLIFVLCLLAALISVIPNVALKDPNLLAVVKQVPKVTFENGEVSIDRATPYAIKDIWQHPIIEFRTGEKGAAKLSEEGPRIVVTKDTVVMGKPGSSAVQTFELAEFKNGLDRITFDSNDVERALRAVLFWAPILTFLFTAPLIFVGHLFQILVYALIVQGICKSLEQPISYSAAMRLSAVAITPCIVIAIVSALIATFVNVNSEAKSVLTASWKVVSVIVAVVYLVVAAHAVKQSRQRESNQASS